MPTRPKPFRKESITVAYLVQMLREAVGLDLDTLNEVDTQHRLVTEADLHRPGLALAGYVDLFTHHRVQILGNTENQYLQHLSTEAQAEAFGHLVQFDVPCVFLTHHNRLPDALLEMATARGIPVFATPAPSTRFMAQLGSFLDDQFALQQSVHGALVDVYGVGILLVGKAGIGKSEVALDLVERGHRLVADDVVILTKKESVLMGSGTNLVQHFMEIRGLGLVDIRAMFGIRAIRFQKRAEIVVQMQLWDENEEYTRLGMIDDIHEIMGVELPLVKLPITTGKNVTVICEVIAMNHLLRHYGYDPAEVFKERLAERIRTKSASRPERGTQYFEGDYE
ncbi:MAG: HPr(Ser) kinase/phosphatase [Bacteroidota bacterium]